MNEERPDETPGPRPVVAVFAKAPVPGKVKTRLTPALHAQEAADLYRSMLLDTIAVVERAGLECVVAFAPSGARRELERLLGSRRRLAPQPPGDLGQRMEAIFEGLLEDRRRPAIAIGSDCPAVDAERLTEAAEKLEEAEVVVGPALDGGYYLLGLRRPRPELFRDIPWSTGGVTEETRRRIDDAGLRSAWLEPARDLDTPEDLFEWYANGKAEGLPDTYPRTWRTLSTILSPRRFAALEEAVLGGEA